MNTLDINTFLLNDAFSKNIFAGTYAIDKLPKSSINKKKWCCCANLSPSNESGSHWIAIFLDKDDGEFFCSFGTNPFTFNNYYLNNFLYYNNVERYNSKCLQNYFSSYCGFYVIAYILVRSRGYTLDNFLDCFESNKNILNDEIIRKFFERAYYK